MQRAEKVEQPRPKHKHPNHPLQYAHQPSAPLAQTKRTDKQFGTVSQCTSTCADTDLKIIQKTPGFKEAGRPNVDLKDSAAHQQRPAINTGNDPA